MRKHSDAVLAAFAGFVLTSAVMLPPVLSASAEKAARIVAYEEILGPNTTRFGSDRVGRLASAIRDGNYRDEARQQIVTKPGERYQQTR